MTRIPFETLDLRDALDLAILIEQEAAERYTSFVSQTGQGYYGDAADVFAHMAVNEAKHGAQLAARRQHLFGDAPSRVDASMIFDVEAPDHSKPRTFMSPRQALEVARDGEQKAFEFYRDAIGHITDAEVRALFHELQAEEADHMDMIEGLLQHLPAGPEVEEHEADEPPAM